MTLSTVTARLVRRTLAAARVLPDGRVESAPAASLFDVVPADGVDLPRDENVAATQGGAELIMWARQHLFERVFLDAKAEREHVAGIQEDFLKRSFNSLLSQADSAILAAEEEAERGIHGAEGRMRKAELVKEQHEHRRRLRLEETQRGRTVVRGDVAVIGSALLLPLPVVARQYGSASADEGARSSEEIEQIAVQIARSL